MAIFNDRVSRVLAVLGNRADLVSVVAPNAVSRVMGWIRDSYINLCMSYQLETLEVSVPGTLGPGTQGSLSSIPYPPDCRLIDAITLTYPDGSTFQPDFKDMQYVRMFNVQEPGPPSVWAPQNETIWLAPYADQSYPYILDYYQLPQILDDSGNVLDPSQSAVDIGETPILLPYDWLEILDYGAEMRGHAELLEREKATALQQLLFGFTVPLTNKFVPGLIGQIMTRRQAQAPKVDYGIQPRSPRRNFTNTAG
jgi:hypothetical protein